MIKDIKKTLIRIVIAIAIIMGTSTVVNAQKLDLDDKDGDQIKIEGVGVQKSGDSEFKLNEGVTLPKQINISELAINYKGKEKNLLTIKEIDSKGEETTLFSYNVTGGLTPEEFEKGIHLILRPENTYVFTHGSKEWTLKFGSPSTATPSYDKNTSTGETTQDELPNKEEANNGSNGTVLPWWVYIIFGVLILCGVVAYFIGKKESAPENNLPLKDDDNKEENENLLYDLDDPNKQEINDKYNTLVDRINSIIPDESNSLTPEDKLDKLQFVLKNYRASYDALKSIRKLVDVEEEMPAMEVVRNLENKLNDIQTPSLNPPIIDNSKQLQNKFACEILERIANKKNKMLNEILNKSKAGVKDHSSETDIILRFVDLLSIHVESKQESVASPTKIKIESTKELSHPDNRRIAKVWAIEQIEQKGFTGLNKNNSCDEVFQRIAELMLKGSQDTPICSEEDIVNAAIIDDKLSEDQKKIILRRLIEKLNEQLNKENRLDSRVDMGTFLKVIANAIQQPSSHEEAQELERQDNLKSVNEILNTNIEKFDENSLRNALQKAILAILNKRFPELKGETADVILDQLQNSIKSYSEIKGILNSFGVDDAKDLPQAIRNKQFEDLRKSVSNKLVEILPDGHFDSSQKLVNALIKVVEEDKQTQEVIIDDVNAKIKKIKGHYEPSDKDDLLSLIGSYDTLIDEREKTMQDKLNSVENNLSEEQKLTSSLRGQCEDLKKENDFLKSESNSLVNTLNTDVEKVLEARKPILIPCSDNEENQCVDIEDRLYQALDISMNKFREYQMKEGATPVETRKEIQKLLEAELVSENSPVNTICRYYSYSRLPFMTDSSREYGIIFNRRNMNDLFNAVKNLYVNFGIALDLPSLFVMGVEEVAVENVTGQFYGDLDNLCPSSRNHVDYIDSKKKPSDIIVDVVNVGYTIDGRRGRYTSVLTY